MFIFYHLIGAGCIVLYVFNFEKLIVTHGYFNCISLTTSQGEYLLLGLLAIWTSSTHGLLVSFTHFLLHWFYCLIRSKELLCIGDLSREGISEVTFMQRSNKEELAIKEQWKSTSGKGEGHKMSSECKAGATSRVVWGASKGVWISPHVLTGLLAVFWTGERPDLTVFVYLAYIQNSFQILTLRGVMVSWVF